MDAFAFTPEFSPEQGLWGLLAGSFLSATVLPGGSEALLFGFLQQHPDDALLAVLIATLGNTAGGMISWWCGRYLPRWQKFASLPYMDKVQQWGSPILLLSWTPIFGDALCLAAGWLKLRWLPCMIFMAIGKAARYWLISDWAL